MLSDTPRASEEERLDEETERVLLSAYAAAFDHAFKKGSWRKDEWSEADYAEQSRLAGLADDEWQALRSRIRTLIREAESHGAEQVRRMIQIAEDFGG